MLNQYDGVKDLATRIVTQMVTDYYKCLVNLKNDNFKRPKDKQDTIIAINNYEAFFTSDRFLLYSNFPGKKIIRIVRERVNDEIN